MRRLYLFDCRNKDSFSQLIYLFFLEMYLTTFLTIIARYYLFYQVMSLGLRLNFFRLTNMSTLMSVRGFFLALLTSLEDLWSHYLGMSHFDDTASFGCSSLVCFFLLERKSLLTAPLLMLFLCNNVRASVTLKPVEQIS